MPIKTLSGIFEPPKKPPKRNFIKENVNSVRQMQTIIRDARIGALYASQTTNNLLRNHSEYLRSNVQLVNKNKSREDIRPTVVKKKKNRNNSSKTTFSDRSVQTLPTLNYSCDINSPIPKLELDEQSVERDLEELKINNDQNNNCMTNTEPQVLNKTLKNLETIHNHYNKYEEDDEDDIFCPPGHILLPEIERKQTLKSLKQRYDSKIYELNSLSFRSDTLRIKRKRSEIEEELRRLDAGIRTFERPRVYIRNTS